MSIYWNWEKKIGQIECCDKKDGTYLVNVYQGNCLCVLIKKTEMQNKFYTFFSDELHLKKCVGLEKANDKQINLFADVWIKWKLNTFFSDSIVIAKILVKAGFIVELYYEEIKENV